MKPPVNADPTIKEQITVMQDQYDKTQTKITRLRKRGLDVKIEELQIIRVIPQLKMYEATKETKDLEKAKLLLEDIEASLKLKEEIKSEVIVSSSQEKENKK